MKRALVLAAALLVVGAAYASGFRTSDLGRAINGGVGALGEPAAAVPSIPGWPSTERALPAFNGEAFLAAKFKGNDLVLGGVTNDATLTAHATVYRIAVVVYDVDGVKWSTTIEDNQEEGIEFLGAIAADSKVFVHVGVKIDTLSTTAVTAYDPVASDDLSESFTANRAAASVLFAFNATTGKPLWSKPTCWSTHTGTIHGCGTKTTSKKIYYSESSDTVIVVAAAQQIIASQSWTLGETFTTTGTAGDKYDPTYSAAFATADGAYVANSGILFGADTTSHQMSYYGRTHTQRILGTRHAVSGDPVNGNGNSPMRCGRGQTSPLTWQTPTTAPVHGNICVGSSTAHVYAVYRSMDGGIESQQGYHMRMVGSNATGVGMIHGIWRDDAGVFPLALGVVTTGGGDFTHTLTNSNDEWVAGFTASGADSWQRHNTTPSNSVTMFAPASDGDSVYSFYRPGGALSASYNKGESDQADFSFVDVECLVVERDYEGNVDVADNFMDRSWAMHATFDPVPQSQNGYLLGFWGMPNAGSMTFDPGGATEVTYTHTSGHELITVTFDETDWSVNSSAVVADDFNSGSSTLHYGSWGAIAESE